MHEFAGGAASIDWMRDVLQRAECFGHCILSFSLVSANSGTEVRVNDGGECAQLLHRIK
jgi:hypothetical protein